MSNKVGANINSEVLTIDIRDIQCTYPGLGTSLHNVCYAITEKTVVNHWLENLNETPESKGKNS